MSSKIRDTLGITVVVLSLVLIIVAVIALIVTPAYFLSNIKEKQDCDRYERITGQETHHEWAWGQACYVKTDKGTFLLNQVRSEE